MANMSQVVSGPTLTVVASSDPSLHPQVQRSRAAVLEAVVALIEEEGAAAVTHQRVAQRAGVGRATVYRHWPEAVDLLTDALALALASFPFLEPGPGRLVDRVRADLRHVADELNTPVVASMAATITERAHANPAVRAVRDRLVEGIRANLDTAVTAAVAAGELRSAPDLDDLFAQLIGPLWVRCMLQGAPIDDALIDRVVADVLGPWV